MSEESISGTRSTRKRDRIKEFIWPVYKSESKKIISSSFILFFVLATYSILRNMKDSLVQSSELNTEAIPYLKNFAVLPFAILITASFVKLSNVITREKLFYYMIIIFLSVYLLFAFYWYPNIEELKLDAEFIAKLKSRWPFMEHLFSMIQYWMITIFYVFAELWVSVVANLLFWQFINDITTYSESRRFYAIYSLIGHLGPSFSSAIIASISWVYSTNGLDTTYCPGYFMFLISIVVIFATIAMLIFRWMHTNILSTRQANKYGTPVKLEKQKTKLPFKESIKYILNSKYILFLFLIIFAFGVQNNLMGLLWKKNVELYYNGQKVLISNYSAIFYLTTGIVTGVLTLGFRLLIQKVSWFAGAFLGPALMSVICIPYFIIVFSSGDIAVNAMGYVSSPSYFILLILSCQQLMNKAVKYGVVDPTKEMAYIPLDRELRYKGKAAVDVFGYTMSKSVAGLMTIILYYLYDVANLIEVSKTLAFICILMLICWMYSVRRLNRLYTDIAKTKPDS